MENQMKSLFLLFLFSAPQTSEVTHSLRYYYTVVTSPGINIPEFTIVGVINGEQFVYYDSYIKKMTPKIDWIKRISSTEPEYWNRETQYAQGNQEDFKVSLSTAMKRFNHSGLHTVQWMYGCELDDDGTRRGYDQYGYDGEDFLILDPNTVSWTAPTPKAFITKNKWDHGGDTPYVKNYLESTCVEWLQKYVGYGRDTLERKVPPKTELFQKDSSSPLVCLATGFFPKEVMMYWQKDGEEVHEDVKLTETVPNPDGTFQKRSILTVSPEELQKNKYSCVIEHSGVKKIPELRVLNGGGSLGLIIGAVVAVLLLVLIGCVGFYIWKKKSDYKPANQTPSEDTASDKS